MIGADMRKGMLFEAVAVILLIALVFLLYFMVTTSQASEQWTISGIKDIGTRNNLFVGDDGSVYTVDGKSIHAISGDGHAIWDFTIPDLLNCSSNTRWSATSWSTDNGSICVVLDPNTMSSDPSLYEELLVISPKGTLLWGKTYSLDDVPDTISIKNSSLYTLSADWIEVYNPDGSTAWKKCGKVGLKVFSSGNSYIRNQSVDYESFTFDENGTVYLTVQGHTGKVEDHTLSVSIMAIGPNGSLYWNKSIQSYSAITSIAYPARGPIYHNHTIYVLYSGGLIALAQDGSVVWNKTFDSTPEILGFFSDQDNIYLREGSRISYMSSNGNETTIIEGLDEEKSRGIIDLPNNTIYLMKTVSGIDGSETGRRVNVPNSKAEIWLSQLQDIKTQYPLLYNRTLGQLDSERIYAYALDSGKPLWNYTLPLDEHSVILNKSNYQNIVPYYYNIDSNGNMTPSEWYRSRNVTYGASLVDGGSQAYPILSGGVLYVRFWSYNFEVPTFLGLSNSTYAGGIYALDKNGTILWSYEPDSMVQMMEVRNGTIYYGTNDGRMSVARVDAAAGFALTAAAYLFIRFFLAGAVTRARSRIASNENRNRVLKFIADNPGSSLYEVCRGLKMNKGTARYHLLILGINHRIASFKADDKYVRYFTNSGSYSEEQQLIISIVKRDGVRKVLNALLERPGLSNVELATELGMQESATLRYIRELSERGLVTRDRSDEGRLSYSIKNEHKDTIVSAMGRLNDP